MDAVDFAVVAGAILSPVVAITAIVAGEYRSKRERKATLDLARVQHEHERSARRGERYFEKRSELYDTVIRFLILGSHHITKTEPLIELGPMPDVPWEASYEQLTTMQVQLKLYGSRDVEHAFERFLDKQSDFFGFVETFRAEREGGKGVGGMRKTLDEHRKAALGAALDV